MALITRFEDIQARQEARKLVKMIYELTNSGTLAEDFGLRDQLEPTAISSMTELAEGFDCESKAEFARSPALPAGLPWKFNPCSTLHLIFSLSPKPNSKSITNRQGKPKH